MTNPLNVEQMIIAIHALTGVWMSGRDAEKLSKEVGTREELLAHGILDLGWLDGTVPGGHQFAKLRQSFFLPVEPLLGVKGPASPTPDTRLERDSLLTLVMRFVEEPTEVSPITSLKQLGAVRPSGV